MDRNRQVESVIGVIVAVSVAIGVVFLWDTYYHVYEQEHELSVE